MSRRLRLTRFVKLDKSGKDHQIELNHHDKNCSEPIESTSLTGINKSSLEFRCKETNGNHAKAGQSTSSIKLFHKDKVSRFGNPFRNAADKAQSILFHDSKP